MTFDSVIFDGSVDFAEAKFVKSAFRRTQFLHNAAFADNTFSERILFEDICSVGSFTFARNTLEKRVELKRCNIAQFVYIYSPGQKLTLNRVHHLEDPEEGWQPTKIDCRDQDCSHLIFIDTDLSRADFLGAQISETWFESHKWASPPGKKPYAQVFEHEKHQKKNPGLLQSLYRQLKRRYEEIREFPLSGDFHYWEMELRERSLPWRGHKAEKLLLKAYRFFADFGESYKKLLFWILFSIPLAASGIYLSENCGIATWLAALMPEPLSGELTLFYANIKRVLLAFVPVASFKYDALKNLNDFSKLILTGGAIFEIILVTLFVMAVRRRFKR